jgi:hypothetical protein
MYIIPYIRRVFVCIVRLHFTKVSSLLNTKSNCKIRIHIKVTQFRILDSLDDDLGKVKTNIDTLVSIFDFIL